MLPSCAIKTIPIGIGAPLTGRLSHITVQMKSVLKIILILFALYPSTVYPKDSKSRVIKTFHEYVQLNDIFIASVPKESPSNIMHRDLRQAVERYGEDVFNPILAEAVNLFCINKDLKLLSEYFQVIIRTTNSADEYPSYILGKMFICRTTLFSDLYKKLSIDEKKIIYESVDWGFKNITYQKENEVSEYTVLKQKLENLKILIKK
jgi:hypothetical protein